MVAPGDAFVLYSSCVSHLSAAAVGDTARETGENGNGENSLL